MPIYLLQKIKPEECETGESIRMVVWASTPDHARRLASEASSNKEELVGDWFKEEATECHVLTTAGHPVFFGRVCLTMGVLCNERR
jgi:hypothetical protein